MDKVLNNHADNVGLAVDIVINHHYQTSITFRLLNWIRPQTHTGFLTLNETCQHILYRINSQSMIFLGVL